VPAVKPEIVLTKVPVPVPSEVFVGNAIVGFGEVLQTTPLPVTLPPPSEVMFPPLDAPVRVIDVIGVVVTVGNEGGCVVNVSSEP